MPVQLPERPDGVPESAVGSYSQFGEAIDIDWAFGKDFIGTAVDVGASDGISNSNTAHLEARGWTVLCIEPNRKYEQRLRANRAHVQMVACGAKHADNVPFKVYEVTPGNFEAGSALNPSKSIQAEMKKAKIKQRTIKVAVRTLDSCLEQARLVKLDLVSIDVEGGEVDVLAGFNIDFWKPRVVILEDWDGGQHRPWMCRHGYYIKARRGVNEVFIRV